LGRFKFPSQNVLSISSFHALEKCPRQFYLRKRAKQFFKIYQKGTSYGTIMHEVLAKCWQNWPNVQSEEQLSNLVKAEYELEHGLFHGNHHLGPDMPILDETQLTEFMESVRWVFETHQRKNIGKPCMIEETLIDESGKYGGIIDIVFEAEKDDALDSNVQNSRQIIVVDWKWGKRPSKAHMAKYGEQLQFYSHLLKRNGYNVKGAQIWWIQQHQVEDIDISEAVCFEKMENYSSWIWTAPEEKFEFKTGSWCWFCPSASFCEHDNYKRGPVKDVLFGEVVNVIDNTSFAFASQPFGDVHIIHHEVFQNMILEKGMTMDLPVEVKKGKYLAHENDIKEQLGIKKPEKSSDARSFIVRCARFFRLV